MASGVYKRQAVLGKHTDGGNLVVVSRRPPRLATMGDWKWVLSHRPGRTVLAATPPSPSMVLRGESGEPLLTTVSMRLDQSLVQSVGQFCSLCGPGIYSSQRKVRSWTFRVVNEVNFSAYCGSIFQARSC
nr:hypothetical protein BgiMline_006832 [Biomphalaria glabrata]